MMIMINHDDDHDNYHYDNYHDNYHDDDDDDDEELRCQWMYIPPGQRVGLWSWWFGGLWRISLATSDASMLRFTWDSHGFFINDQQ